MRTGKVVLLNRDAGDGLETMEWWYGGRMTALVDYFIPRWLEVIETAEDAGIASNSCRDIAEMLTESIVTVDELRVFSRTGTELLLWLGFSHYRKDGKVVVLDAHCSSQTADIVHRLCDSPEPSLAWRGCLVFTLLDTRIGTLVMSDSETVLKLSTTELAELCHHV